MRVSIALVALTVAMLTGPSSASAQDSITIVYHYPWKPAYVGCYRLVLTRPRLNPLKPPFGDTLLLTADSALVLNPEGVIFRRAWLFTEGAADSGIWTSSGDSAHASIHRAGGVWVTLDAATLGHTLRGTARWGRSGLADKGRYKWIVEARRILLAHPPGACRPPDQSRPRRTNSPAVPSN